MSLFIADTRRGTFFFCDQGTADAIMLQLRYQGLDGVWALPNGIYVIVLPEDTEVSCGDVGDTTGPAIGKSPIDLVAIEQEAVLERIRQSRR